MSKYWLVRNPGWKDDRESCRAGLQPGGLHWQSRFRRAFKKQQEGVVTEKVIDLHRYKNAKNDYQKLLDSNPHTLLTFEDYFKVKTFLENVHQAKLRKKMKNQRE